MSSLWGAGEDFLEEVPQSLFLFLHAINMEKSQICTGLCGGGFHHDQKSTVLSHTLGW